ncbi:hypothetical protein [Natrinema longum]|uniref:Uncharacterized protein n=1 Tax=Natrinema longum TaxID=370324 RepID=A0A8A2U7B6_9EURY|nr:hypothetical protein [Natrinema longum]MBZ6494143.1 hypothetical protein [Natrinema longum]QSW84527.1 hypothetical protein J0X27_13865 [Natrinema longum]
MAIDLPPAVADDWRRLGGRTDERSLSLATVTAETTVFEHRPTADALKRLRADGDVPARSLFTVDLAISPSLSAIGLDPGDALELAAPKAREVFVETVEDDGIAVGGERASEFIDRPDGAVGHLTVLEVAYPTDGATATDGGTSDDTGDESATIDAEAHVAVWPAADAYAMAGGIVPLEAPDDADLLAAALDVDPTRDREAIVDLFRGLDLEPASDD